MTEYTQEEIDKLVADKVAHAVQMQHIFDTGKVGLQMAIEYLQDQVNHKIIPQSIVDTMCLIQQKFIEDMTGTSQNQEPKPEPE